MTAPTLAEIEALARKVAREEAEIEALARKVVREEVAKHREASLHWQPEFGIHWSDDDVQPIPASHGPVVSPTPQAVQQYVRMDIHEQALADAESRGIAKGRAEAAKLTLTDAELDEAVRIAQRVVNESTDGGLPWAPNVLRMARAVLALAERLSEAESDDCQYEELQELRSRRTAEEERADVVAWLLDEAQTTKEAIASPECGEWVRGCAQFDINFARRIAPKVTAGEHVGAAAKAGKQP